MSNFTRTLSLLLVFACAAASAGFGQEKQQPKKKKEEPEVIAKIAKVPAEYNAASWKKFESAQGGFSVLFPGTPQEETLKVEAGGKERLVHHLKLQEMAIYSVMYVESQMPPSPDPDAAAMRDFFDSYVKSVAERFKAEPLAQKEIMLDGHPGRFIMQRRLDGLIMRLKMYAVGPRLYQLMITTPPEQGATDDQRRFYEATANKFLDSFALAPVRVAEGGAPGASAASEGGSISVSGPSGPVGPIATGSVRGEASAPKNLPRAQVNGGVLNGKATSRPAPAYPAAALKERAEGVVVVAVVVDEEGRVMAAEAVSGHELLRAAAVGAALKARFPVTRLSGQPVKVSGLLTYNFLLH